MSSSRTSWSSNSGRPSFRRSTRVNNDGRNSNNNNPNENGAAPNLNNPADLSCLIALLKSFAETNANEDEGIEHPIAFYDENEKKCRREEAEEERRMRWRKRRRGIIAAVLLLLLIGILLIAVLVSKNNREERSTRASAAAQRERECGGGRLLRSSSSSTRSPEQQILRELALQDLDQRMLDVESKNKFSNIGCFRLQYSPDNRTVYAETWAERVQACDAACPTHYFGIAAEDVDEDEFEDDEDTVTCYCYVDRPKERLNIGPCHRVEVLYDPCINKKEQDRQEMEVFYDPLIRTECNQDTTSTVRNFLVEEDDVPFGFDIITNSYRTSPFELYKDECGTNVYEVQTEVSVLSFVFLTHFV